MTFDPDSETPLTSSLDVSDATSMPQEVPASPKTSDLVAISESHFRAFFDLVSERFLSTTRNLCIHL